MAQIAFSGNLVAPAEIKFAAGSGKAVAKARIAENHSQLNRDTQQFEETGTSWRNIVAFGKRAEKLAEVQKGQRLVIIGRESSRTYSKDGEEKSWTETAIDEFGVVPRGDTQQPRPSGQGEQWNAQPQQSYVPQQSGGWPATAQPPQPAQQGFPQDPPF